MSWHMSPWYGHGILVSGYPVLTAVNWPYCECPILKSFIKDVDLPRYAWDTPPFLLIVSPTPPVQSVDAYARTLGQSCDNQTKRGWPYSMGMWLCPTRASRAREPRYYNCAKWSNWARKPFCLLEVHLVPRLSSYWKSHLPQGLMGCICAHFLSFVFISHVVERKLRQDQQIAHSRWRFSFS